MSCGSLGVLPQIRRTSPEETGMVFHHIFLGKTGAKQGEILADPPFERYFT